MRIVLSEDKERRWKWFRYDDAGVELELYLPRSSEYQRIFRQFGVGTDECDTTGLMRYVAHHWFRTFRGLSFVDEAGQSKELPNTADLRFQVFDQTPALWGFAFRKILDYTRAVTEGNVDSGSACSAGPSPA